MSNTELSLKQPGGEVALSSAKELQVASAISMAQHEIEAPLVVAKRFPRSEDLAFQKLMVACGRASFAADAVYSFPRGGETVTGPSVNLAREAARIWGNIEFGLHIIRDDAGSMLIRGWAWDKETNVRVNHEDSFNKLIQRKDKKTGVTTWVVPDERDLRELVNRRGAILVRNSLLQIMPKDLIEDALYTCKLAMEKAATDDPEAARKRLLVDFGALGVSVEQIEKKLGHPFAQSTPKQIAELRGICKSIQDGNTTWAEYVKEEPPTNGGTNGGPEKPVDPAPKKPSTLGDTLKKAAPPGTQAPAPAPAPVGQPTTAATAPLNPPAPAPPGDLTPASEEIKAGVLMLEATAKGRALLAGLRKVFKLSPVQRWPSMVEQHGIYAIAVKDAVSKL